ncbi:beta-1,6-N-acetylglucosaminyltransferase [Psychrobacter sanguinis]|uniref:beta-1,6-N-acetylglucosaminyltransferase n=1 Tax=Psychrobacter sanguinis TaxID=861445 RepID=UPI00020C7A2C|nr:beta-1,6-N-acetylglucosaminyltransferase [Psychrobacter sanguinis]EGK13940.1 core-2/I-Branching enzyme superfamily protein [Psychrobacter sp. 1501(2011)]MCD9150520.1 beta-1,6-N-acetylglucosaminyltransferase [Psychrobacter sanguinis]
MQKHALLILSHSNIDHVYEYAKVFPQYNFYIHQDIKFPINLPIPESINNIFIIPKENSVSVSWGGFSMIQATNSLFEYAFQNKDNIFFHLISGNDLILQPLERLSFDENSIYMECIESYKHRYRVRFNTPHADTSYQRSIIGKSITLGFKILDRIIPTKEKCLFGSQWFSIHRKHLEIILKSIDGRFNDSFQKKLCPDEHYYQYLVYKNNLQAHLSKTGNRRFIIFDKDYNNGNNPIFLDIDDINNIDRNKYWFARKVAPITINNYLKLVGFK